MTDEKYLFVSDVKEKKNIARSAHNRRTHTGKGGKVMMPSDYLTRKEKAAMNGEVKSYNLNKPMTWKEWKAMPEDIQIQYILLIRKKWGTPDKYIAEMMGVNPTTFCRYAGKLGIGPGSDCGNGHIKWDQVGFDKWRFGVDEKKVEEDDEETGDLMTTEELSTALGYELNIPVCRKDSPSIVEETRSIPASGYLDFDCPASYALRMINTILGDTRVKLSVTWEVSE